MKKFLEKYSNLDDALKRHFGKFYSMVIILIIGGAYFGVAYRSLSMALFFVILALIALMFTYSRIMSCLSEKIVFADGEIVEIFMVNALKKKVGRNYMVIKQDEIFIKIYYHNVKRFKEHNVIRLYFPSEALRRENADTYVCSAVFLIDTLKTAA